MMKRSFRPTRTLAMPILSILLSIGAVTAACAQSRLFLITLDTFAMPIKPAGNYALDLQLNGTHGSKVIVNRFDFGGGDFSDMPSSLGAVDITPSAGATQSVTLGATDTGFLFNEFTQNFTPGSKVQFDVEFDSATQNPNDPIPDRFVFGIIDQSGDLSSSSLQDGLGGFEYVTLDMPLDMPPLAAGDFTTYSYSAAGGVYRARVQADVPESNGAIVMLIAGMCALATQQRRLRKYPPPLKWLK